MRAWIPVALLAGACHPASPASPPVAAPATATPPVAPACADPAYRAFDFWIGTWEVAIHARQAPGATAWADARGTQRVESIVGGCALAEHFAADGPGTPWAGTSLSSWQPALGRWRQTWVDDQGGYLAFVGGIEDGAMTLYGEPRTVNDQVVQMRMRFEDVTADALRWRWQRTTDGGATWEDQMIIAYRRAR